MAEVLHVDRSDAMPDDHQDWVRITCNPDGRFVVGSRTVGPEGTVLDFSSYLEPLETTLKRAIALADELGVSIVHVLRDKET